ncbi:hypothetical protein ABZ914_24465 [Spirillospora sp. NPDC046719]
MSAPISARGRSAVLSSASAQPVNRARSATGTPSRSQMTWMGSGSPNSSTRSAGAPDPIIASRRRPAIRSVPARSVSTRRGVNVRYTKRRSRVWSGGSSLSSVRLVGSAGVIPAMRSAGIPARSWSRPKAGLLSTVRACSYRVTSQAGSPYPSRTRTGAPPARASASNGEGRRE